MQKATSTPKSSHDKNGTYGGVSSYTDADVVQARAYMKDVLGIEAMEINGRDLAHILAEVYGFSQQNDTIKTRLLQQELENYRATVKVQLESYRKTINQQEADIQSFQSRVNSKIEAAKKVEEQAVAHTSTVRRIKD